MTDTTTTTERPKTAFQPGGPKRYRHQIKGLKKLIETGGVGALIMDPGTGKTACALDFCSILALKQPVSDEVQEARVLVVCPLAAVDTWVKQAAVWVSPQVNYWAEVLGGSISQRALALGARGGSPNVNELLARRVAAFDLETERGVRSASNAGCRTLVALNADTKTNLRRLMKLTGADSETVIQSLKMVRKEGIVRAPRAWGHENSIDQGARGEGREIGPEEGPEALGTEKPRLIIEVLNFDTFSSRQGKGSGTMADVMLNAVKRYDPHLVIIDESHKIKSATSNVSRALDRVGQVVDKRIILTGTVMPAGPLDVFGQWRFLDPYEFGDRMPDETVKRATLATFKSRFAQMGGYMGHQVVGYKNLDELQTIMARKATVVRKQDALDLPPVTQVVVPVMLSAREKTAYNDMKKNLTVAIGPGSGLTAQNKMTAAMRLRQITAGHLPDDAGIVHDIGDSKVATIASIVEDQLVGEDRIVIFGTFVHEVDAIAKRLAKEGTTILKIDGSTSGDTRMAYRKRFISDDPARLVIVAQIRTVSLAVNEFVSASNVIFGSLTQQRDDLIQAIDRLHRIGQTRPVTVWFAEAPGTIDGVIHGSHNDRTDLESAVLQHIFDDGSEL